MSDSAAEAERQVDEVVHVLSPGPLAQSEHSNPPTHEELAAAGTASTRRGHLFKPGVWPTGRDRGVAVVPLDAASSARTMIATVIEGHLAQRESRGVVVTSLCRDVCSRSAGAARTLFVMI